MTKAEIITNSIKDCPFCGNKGKLESEPLFGSDSMKIYHRIWCIGDERHGLDALFDTAEEAISYWNQRISNE
jgi:hypothetical protein